MYDVVYDVVYEVVSDIMHDVVCNVVDDVVCDVVKWNYFFFHLFRPEGSLDLALSDGHTQCQSYHF